MNDWPNMTVLLQSIDSRAWLVQEWDICFERQRPATAHLVLNEPVTVGDKLVLSIGEYGQLTEKAVFEVLTCEHSATEEIYQIRAVEPVRRILDALFIYQGDRVTLGEACSSLCGRFGLTFRMAATKRRINRHRIKTFGTVRNTLDQFAQIWKLGKERFDLDLIKGELVLRDGHSNKAAIKIPTEAFLEHDEELPEFNTLPSMKPFVLVSWLGKDQVVDFVQFESQGDLQGMKLGLVDV